MADQANWGQGSSNSLTDAAGMPANEQTVTYGGQSLGQYTISDGGVVIPSLGSRKISSSGTHVPSYQDIADISKANQLTGGGVQNMAANIAHNAATGNGTNSGKFDSNGKPTNPILKTSSQEDYEAARMILSETHGSFTEMVKIGEVLRNRVLIAQNDQAKNAGTPNAPTVKGQIYARGQFSAYNGVTGYANGRGANYLATKNYNGSEADFQKALRAWQTACAGSNLTNGSTNFWAKNLGARGLAVQNVGTENYFLSPANGYTYKNSSMDSPYAASSTPTGFIQAKNPGQYVANNVRHNNIAQIMQRHGHQPTVAEVSMLGLSNYNPQVATAWANAMKNNKGHKSIQEMIKEGGSDASAWSLFVSQYTGKVSHQSLSPSDHLKIWINSFFRPHKTVAAQKWNILNINQNFIKSCDLGSLTSAIDSKLLSSISSIDNVWKNIGPDGPIAHGIQNVLANIFTPTNSALTSTPINALIQQAQQQINVASSGNLQLNTILGDAALLALHSDELLNNVTNIPSSLIIANLAFPGSTNLIKGFNSTSASLQYD